MNKCGFSLKSALEVSKQVHFETPYKPDSVLAVFKKYGFSKSHILNLVRRRPAVLLSKPKTTLLPKLEFFKSKGFSSPDVIKIISSYPWVFKYSLENQLVPAFDFLENSLQSDAVAIKTIKRFPRILNVTVENMARVVDVLRDSGVPEKNIALLIRSRPSIMVSNLENFKKLIEEVTLMGFHPCKSQFIEAIRVLSSMSKSTWEKKLDVHRKWGLSEEEILQAFVKCPWFMSLSEEKIMAVMDLFVNKLGWESAYIAKNPTFSSYSLEKRLIPRALVLQFLVSIGLVEKSFRSLAFFNTPEDKFRQVFIDRHGESTRILKFYEEKLNLSSAVNSSTF
ncbi:transcription termination factor MTERF8 [Populus alba x Populus x berolinensis]|nr:transcription termination factor MTERF8 [Populus alba x Populus x berolinensis]